MDYPEIVHLVNTDPVVQTLLEAPIPMRLGYVGLDGHPRTVPLAYLWDGNAFVFASPPTAYKVKAIATHPEVAFTVDTFATADTRAKVEAVLGVPVADHLPLIVMVRGTASVEIQRGVPPEHIDAARRYIGDDEKHKEMARVKRANMSEMALIKIIPTHVTVCDYITRFPPPVEINARFHGADMSSLEPVLSS